MHPTTRTVLIAVALVTALRVAYLNFDLLPLFGDEAQYWSWSLDPALGYYSKPPMIAWLIAATTAVAGHGAPSVKLASALSHAATALMIFLIGSRLGGRRVGMWSSLIYLTMPGVSYSSAIISTDPPLLMFWSVALYAFVRAAEPCVSNGALELDGVAGTDLEPGRASPPLTSWWLATGIAFGGALLSKYTAVAFVVSAALFLVRSRCGRRVLRSRGPLLALTAALLVVAPNLMWNARYGFVSMRHVADNASWGGELFNPGRLAEFVLAQFGVFGPLPFACLLLMLARWRRSRADRSLDLLLCFTAPLLAAICVQALIAQAYANWAAPIYVAASIAITIQLLHVGCRRWVAATVAVHLAAGIALAAYEPTLRALDLQVPSRLDLLKRVRGWPEVGRRVDQLRRLNPGVLLLGEDRMVIALCLYYGGFSPSSAYSWNPDGSIRHHYDLRSDMNDALGRDFIFVTYSPRADTLDGCFAAISPVPPIEVVTHPDRILRLHVFRLEGFLGYQGCSQGER